MTDSLHGADPGKAGQLLQDLGLTATEAAVYCTALQSCAEEPVSSYKLAQAMGRDPANVAKILSALVRLQAMTIVQDKPRLYLPTEPAEFTDQVLARLRQSSNEAVELLRQYQIPLPEGVTLPLAGSEQIYGRARALLSGGKHKAIVFGSKEALREIGAELEVLAETDGCRVQVLSPLAMVSEKVEIAVFNPPGDLSELMCREFLQVVVDDRAWLSAVLAQDLSPQGWWGNQAAIAAVLGGSLSLAWQAGYSAQPIVSIQAPDEAPVPDLPTGATEFEPEPELESETPPAPEPTPEPEPAPPPEFEEGLTFLVKHEPATDIEKGER